MEEFRDIPGYEGLYQVSNIGRVKSLKFGKEKLLKASLSKDGYFYVDLYQNGYKKTYQLHQLAAIAFLNHIPCGVKTVVDHINDNPSDNRVENLQVITQRENSYKTQGNYSSNYKGVCWNKNAKKWQSRLRIGKNRFYLGLFEKEYDAHVAYQNKLLSLSN